MESLFVDENPAWDFDSPQPPPPKRIRRHLTDHMNNMLDSVWEPPNPGFAAAQRITDSDVSDIADLDAEIESENDSGSNENPFVISQAEESDN